MFTVTINNKTRPREKVRTLEKIQEVSNNQRDGRKEIHTERVKVKYDTHKHEHTSTDTKTRTFDSEVTLT